MQEDCLVRDSNMRWNFLASSRLLFATSGATVDVESGGGPLFVGTEASGVPVGVMTAVVVGLTGVLEGDD